jgi:Probable N6-adenine methyltransferase
MLSPVDFDWRFDGPTASRLAETLMSGNRRDNLCVGTPTVCEVVNNRGGHAFLIDRNPLIAQALGAGTYLISDLSTEQDLQKLVGRQFDTALIDPPWYTEAYHLWMRRTLPLMRSGASVFVVLFRAFTRANAQSERDKLLECFRRIGHVSFLGYEAVYSTPPF